MMSKVYKLMETAKPNIFLVVLMLISTVLCFLCIHEGHVWGDDFALYIAQAKSLLEGTTTELLEKNIYLTDNSDIIDGGPIGPYLYPMGFPLLLSGIYALKGLDFVAMKGLCGFFFILSLPFLYHLFATRFTDKKSPILLTAYIAFNFAFVSFTDNVLSDFPFFFFTLLGLYLIDRNRLMVVHQVVLSLVIIGSYLIRDVGIFLIPVLAVQLFFKARQTQEELIPYVKKTYLYLLPFVLFSAFWVSKGAFLVNKNDNLMTALLRTNTHTIVTNVAYYVYILGELLGIKNNIPLGLGVMSLCGSVVLMGMYGGKKKDIHFIVFVVLTMGLYIIFPGRQGLRYLFPIVPFVFYFFMLGVLKMPFSDQWKKGVFVALAVYIGGNCLYSLPTFKNKITNVITTREAVDMYNYVKTNTLPTDIIVFQEPRLLRLMTERNGFMLKDDLKIQKSTANYLVEIDKPLKSSPNFTPRYQNSTFIIYKINH